MAITIKGMMSRKELFQKYNQPGNNRSSKTLNRRLKTHFKDEFKGVRLFTPSEVQRIVDVIGPWEITLPEE